MHITVFIKCCLSLMFPIYSVKLTARKYKSLFIKRITSEHTAHSIGNEAPHISLQVGGTNGNILIVHFWCQLVLQAVDLDKDTVQLLLIGFELCSAVIALALPQQIAQLQRTACLRVIAVVVLHRCTDSGCVPQLLRPLHKRVFLEVPACFKAVPISF